MEFQLYKRINMKTEELSHLRIGHNYTRIEDLDCTFYEINKDAETISNCPITILFTDDDQDDQHIFKEALNDSKLNYVITCFSDGVQLIEYLNHVVLNTLADILFLDINMPKLNGFECIKIIRDNPDYSKLFIAIYSTSSAENDVEKAYNAGANVYIRKPNDFKRLTKVLVDLLHNSWDKHWTFYNRKNFLVS